MGRSPLRSWLLAVSILFTMLVVGGIAFTTYVIVVDGMQGVAVDSGQRIATAAATIVRETLVTTAAETRQGTLTGTEYDEAVLVATSKKLPEILVRPGVGDASYALYDPQLQPVWNSGKGALWPGQELDRLEAQGSAKVTRSTAEEGSLTSGLLGPAKLTVPVLHVPILLPEGGTAVLDVTYTPLTEEKVIDSVRTPMAVLAISAMLIMVLLMQSSMLWVLNLVDNLRKAADSIKAGQLDARLPQGGANEIGDLARSINRLIERLQRRAEAQARFVADASHELATPVAGIRGYTSILRAWGAEDTKVRDEAIDAIDRESRRMARLTGDLLNLLHADQGLVLKTERFDLNQLVRDRIATTASRWLDKDLEYVGPGDEPLMMAGDSDRVEDIISILLDNAAKYTPPGGRVSALTRRRRDLVVIEISDSGQGIPEQDLPRIFDRFFRSEASRAAGEGGFGLGLAIAKSIVDSMGGDVTVQSIVGEGTTFTVQVPRGRV